MLVVIVAGVPMLADLRQRAVRPAPRARIARSISDVEAVLDPRIVLRYTRPFRFAKMFIFALASRRRLVKTDRGTASRSMTPRHAMERRISDNARRRRAFRGTCPAAPSVPMDESLEPICAASARGCQRLLRAQGEPSSATPRLPGPSTERIGSALCPSAHGPRRAQRVLGHNVARRARSARAAVKPNGSHKNNNSAKQRSGRCVEYSRRRLGDVWRYYEDNQVRQADIARARPRSACKTPS